MIDTSNLDSIGAKIEAIMVKKLSKLKLSQGSSNYLLQMKLNPSHIESAGALIIIHSIAGLRILSMWQR